MKDKFLLVALEKILDFNYYVRSYIGEIRDGIIREQEEKERKLAAQRGAQKLAELYQGKVPDEGVVINEAQDPFRYTDHCFRMAGRYRDIKPVLESISDLTLDINLYEGEDTYCTVTILKKTAS